MNTILHRQIINNYKKNKFTKEEARQIEKEKYDFLYSEKYLAEHAPYGATNHGQAAYEFIKQKKVTSILDVGCGQNDFSKWCQDNDIDCIGVDISSPKADIIAPAHDMPVLDDYFDYVTCFDMMEHLLEEEVDDVLKEFVRIARRGLIFCISYEASKTGVVFQKIKRKEGKLLFVSPFLRRNKQREYHLKKELATGNLHPTVKSQEWWLEKISNYGRTEVLILEWLNPHTNELENKEYIYTEL